MKYQAKKLHFTAYFNEDSDNFKIVPIMTFRLYLQINISEYSEQVLTVHRAFKGLFVQFLYSHLVALS